MDQRRKRPLFHFLGHDPGSIFFRLAGVDDRGQSGLARDRQVHPKQRGLRFAVRVIVIVVKTSFTNSDHLGMSGGV